MDKSNIEKKITEDLLKVTNVFRDLILNISKNITADTNYSYTGDDDIIYGFVINRIIFILSRANKFLPLYNKQTSLLLPINGGRAVNSSSLKKKIGSIGAIVSESASASVSASVTPVMQPLGQAQWSCEHLVRLAAEFESDTAMIVHASARR